MSNKIAQIRSGGQTGVDRAALDAARHKGVPIVGWCPQGGMAEDNTSAPGLLEYYPEMKETPSEEYVQRTAWNVRDSHATLIIAPNIEQLSYGTAMTEDFAEDMKRPCFKTTGADPKEVLAWLDSLGEELTLNVAGPRASIAPEIYDIAFALISDILSETHQP